MRLKTRRRVGFTFVLGLLLLPTELIMLDVLRAEDSRTAAHEWAEDLSAEELAGVASDLFAYPFEYRRAAMAALTPDGRSSAWRGVLRAYSQTHQLTDGQNEVVRRVATFMSAANLGPRLDAPARATLKAIGVDARRLLGSEDAARLLTLKSTLDTGHGRLPMRLRAAQWVRGRVNVTATFENCGCASESSWCRVGENPQAVCRDFGGACSEDTSWPACGDGWAYDCDGICEELPIIGGEML